MSPYRAPLPASPITRSRKLSLKFLILGVLGCGAVSAALFWLGGGNHGSTATLWGGIFAFAAVVNLVGNLSMGSGVASCARCHAELERLGPSGFVVVCPGCGDYFETRDKKLEPLPPGHVAPSPVFGCVLSKASVTWPSHLEQHVPGAPPCCCVCGVTATQAIAAKQVSANLGKTVAVSAALAPVGLAYISATNVSLAIPCCAQHLDGARLEHALMGTDPGAKVATGTTVLFRSRAFAVAFARLNGLALTEKLTRRPRHAFLDPSARVS